MYFGLISLVIALGLFLGMLVFFEIGRHMGIRQTAKHGESARSGIGGIDSAIYALLALILGFAFSGANSRFDHRKALISKEVNAMSTAWNRIDALPAERQPQVRSAFRNYMDAVMAVYDAPPGTADEDNKRNVLARAESGLWLPAMAACLAPDGEKARMLLLPGLNEMFDVVDEERLARRMHPPPIIFLMLALSAFAAAMFGGYNMSNAPKRNWLVIVSVAATISVTTWVILEIEAPRLGLVRVDAFDMALMELRATMK